MQGLSPRGWCSGTAWSFACYAFHPGRPSLKILIEEPVQGLSHSGAIGRCRGTAPPCVGVRDAEAYGRQTSNETALSLPGTFPLSSDHFPSGHPVAWANLVPLHEQKLTKSHRGGHRIGDLPRLASKRGGRLTGPLGLPLWPKPCSMSRHDGLT
jgi:hypothetical protein